MTHVLAVVLCVSAFTSLALAMARQQKAVLGHSLSPNATRGLRAAGWGALALALWVAIRGQGWALGLVSYSGHTSVAAGVVYGALILNGRRGVR